MTSSSSRTLFTLCFILLFFLLAPYWAMAAQDSEPDGSVAEPSAASLLQQLEQATAGELRVANHIETGKVRFLGTTPDKAIVVSSATEGDLSADQAARAFLTDYGPLFGIKDVERDLTLMSEQSLADGRNFVRYQQTYHGIPVLAGEIVVQLKDGVAVISANGEILPDLGLDVMPAVDAAAARETALQQIAKSYQIDAATLKVSEPALWIYNSALLHDAGPQYSALVWRMEVTTQTLQPIRELVLVDAHRGGVALHFNQISMAKDRETYDAQNGSSLPGVLRRSEGNGPYGDTDVDSAHDFAGDTYDFFMNEHGRDSLDNAGMTLKSTTHYCPSPGNCPYGNAFWNGDQMVYGEGFAAADDVVGHELAHGVTDFSSGLFYYYQSGAINESFSDLWGEFIDLTNGAGTDTSGVRWLLGEDIPGIGAIRNMADPTEVMYPGDSPDPDRLGSIYYHCAPQDSGGVHINSGVNNKAIFLMTDGGSFNGYNIATGLGISKVADLYYEAAIYMTTSGSNYNDLYDALIQASINLGFTAAERQTVQDALDAVEMSEPPCGDESPAPVCAPGQTPVAIFQDNLENPASGNWSTGSIAGANGWYYPQMSNPYGLDITYGRSGAYHMWGDNLGETSDSFIAMQNNVMLPANAMMHFYHHWNFEASLGTMGYDGGIVEYSTNGGVAWTDAGSLFSDNGYNGAIESGYGNPLAGRDAFVQETYSYTASRLDLSSLAGNNVRFRFRIGTDTSFGDDGWFIDDIQIYTCLNGADLTEQTFLPLIAKP